MSDDRRQEKPPREEANIGMPMPGEDGSRWIVVDGKLMRERREDVQPLRSLLLVISLGLLVVIASLSIYSVVREQIDAETRISEAEQQAELLHALTIDGCERNNDVRRAISRELRRQNRATARLPHAAFPALSEEQFEMLRKETIDGRRDSIQSLQSVPCEEVYDLDNHIRRLP